MKLATDRLDPDRSILDYLTGRTGLALRDARYGDVAAALAKVQRKFGIADAEQFVHRLGVEMRLFDAVISGITVGETYFMRELAQLDAVRRVILPALVGHRPDAVPLRLWSAGCSTGEEAYSLAMILEEEGLSHRASVLATDISAVALDFARRAEYGEWSMRNDREGHLARYFTVRGKSLKLVDRLRKRVTFESLNLASESYPSRFNGTEQLDLILCRNVLIYFGKAFVRPVAERLYASLADGGWLITGPSDPPLWQHAPFSTVIVPGAVLYRRETGPRTDRHAPAAKPQFRSKTGSAKKSVDLPSNLSAPTKASRADRITAAPVILRDQRGVEGVPQTAEAWLERIQQLSLSADLSQAERDAGEALARYPLSIELHYLRAVLLVALERHDDAITALRSLLYLDRGLAAVHWMLGTLLRRRGDLRAARRSLETAYRLCAACPTLEEVPLCEGETAGRLADGIRAQIAQLKSPIEGR